MAFDVLYPFLLFQVKSILCQTFFYGIYFCLFPIAIYVIVTKGLKTRSRKWLLAMIITMFVLSSVYWIISVFSTFVMIDIWRTQFDPDPRQFPNWLLMAFIIPMVNYIITDGVIIWRAWVLCSDQNRIVLIISVVVLAINTLLYLFTVPMGAVVVISFREGLFVKGIHLGDIINFAQTANLALSLLANILATSVIAVKAWKYRKTLKTSGDGIRTPTRAIRILGLVIESGMLYILVGVVALVGPYTYGSFSFFFYSTGQFAGMYPVVVLLLVETKRSLDTTYFSSSSLADVRGGQRSQLEPMDFAAGPAVATNTQIQIEIESQAPQPRVNDHNEEPVNATSLPLLIS